jgi:hypothetical protein
VPKVELGSLPVSALSEAVLRKPVNEQGFDSVSPLKVV